MSNRPELTTFEKVLKLVMYGSSAALVIFILLHIASCT